VKAKYKITDGGSGDIEYEAIVPQPMQHIDGFTLLGFNSWEDVTDEKLAFAVTNVVEFKLDKETARAGFHD
jgi:hypothetical protein